jgi:hypothetical protein
MPSAKATASVTPSRSAASRTRSGSPTRLGGGDQQQQAGLRGQFPDAGQETLLDLAGQRVRVEQAEPAGHLGRGQPAGQFQQGERVALGLCDYPIADVPVEPDMRDSSAGRARRRRGAR